MCSMGARDGDTQPKNCISIAAAWSVVQARSVFEMLRGTGLFFIRQRPNQRCWVTLIPPKQMVPAIRNPTIIAQNRPHKPCLPKWCVKWEREWERLEH